MYPWDYWKIPPLILGLLSLLLHHLVYHPGFSSQHLEECNTAGCSKKYRGKLLVAAASTITHEGASLECYTQAFGSIRIIRTLRLLRLIVVLLAVRGEVEGLLLDLVLEVPLHGSGDLGTLLGEKS